jgi:hypothetical protein
LVMMVIEDEVELFSGILNNLTAFSCPNKFWIDLTTLLKL